MTSALEAIRSQQPAERTPTAIILLTANIFLTAIYLLTTEQLPAGRYTTPADVPPLPAKIFMPAKDTSEDKFPISSGFKAD